MKSSDRDRHHFLSGGTPLQMCPKSKPSSIHVCWDPMVMHGKEEKDDTWMNVMSNGIMWWDSWHDIWYLWEVTIQLARLCTDTVRPKNQPIDQNVTLTFADNTFHLIGSMLPWAYPLSPLERLLHALFSSKPGQNWHGLPKISIPFGAYDHTPHDPKWNIWNNRNKFVASILKTEKNLFFLLVRHLEG